jgi:hypothetical protein
MSCYAVMFLVSHVYRENVLFIFAALWCAIALLVHCLSRPVLPCAGNESINVLGINPKSKDIA